MCLKREPVEVGDSPLIRPDCKNAGVASRPYGMDGLVNGHDLKCAKCGGEIVIKTGCPRLDDSQEFKEASAIILPHLIGGEISQGQAARELGISVRSLKRYVNQGAGNKNVSEHTAVPGETCEVTNGLPATPLQTPL